MKHKQGIFLRYFYIFRQWTPKLHTVLWIINIQRSVAMAIRNIQENENHSWQKNYNLNNLSFFLCCYDYGTRWSFAGFSTAKLMNFLYISIADSSFKAKYKLIAKKNLMSNPIYFSFAPNYKSSCRTMKIQWDKINII